MIFVSFREYPIAPFKDYPAYMTLNSLNSYLNACASSLHFNLGDSNLEYLVLTLPLSTYTLLSTIPFVEPTNMGSTLTIADPAPTAVVILGIVQTHEDNLVVWQEYNDMDRAIKRVIKIIVPEVYF